MIGALCDHLCGMDKSGNQKPAGWMKPLPVPTHKWDSVSRDLITALSETASGQTEHINRTLQDMLRQCVNPFHTDWDEHLDMAEFAINDAWQESGQNTPFMLTYGQHP